MDTPADTDPRLNESKRAQRALVGARRQRQLQMLQGDIGVLAAKYPELSSVIVGIVSDIQRLASRTRKGDREVVFNKLGEWDRAGGLTVEDLCEETGLSAHAVRAALTELMSTDPPLVEYREREGVAGQPQRIYRHTHTRP
jgi:hypothetical protein